jgi:DtxR family Mn-dependent transcriptional regulator
MAEWHPAFEEYCETIFELGEDDIRVVQARIADRLDVSRPAVSEMTQRMLRAELIELDGNVITLTAGGQELAERVVRRHRLAERFLTDILGLSWADAHREAGKWEHVISEPVESALTRVLGEPTTCPHGNPIPGSAYAPPTLAPLADAPAGARFTIERITEELEFTDGVLDFLESSHLTPGSIGSIVDEADDGSLTVEVAGDRVLVTEFASKRILVSL